MATQSAVNSFKVYGITVKSCNNLWYSIMENSSELKRMISESRRKYKNPYAHLNGKGIFDASISAPISYASIERIVRNLQKNIWKNRHRLWPEGVPTDPVNLLDPSIAIKSIGFDFELAESLGNFVGQGAKSEVAGIIDRFAGRISISRRLPYQTLRFTAAHELGHALLHKETMLHRDRPMDGSYQKQNQRLPIEIEADKFATYFLMPEKLLRERFAEIFGVRDSFILTDDTAFALEPANPELLLNKCKSSRDLSRILAKAGKYNSRQVVTLVEQFDVSVEAMAIRIEELGLVKIKA